MRSGSLKLSLGALALAAGLAGAAIAQAPAPSAAPPEAGHHMMQLTPEQKQARRAEMRQKMETRRAERAKLMHDALGIQPNQENAWKAYQEAMVPPAPPAAPPAENLTTPQRLDRQAARVNEHAATAKKRIDATKRFYAALTPTQQKSFDALQKMHRGDRGGKMRGHHGGRDGRGMGGPGGFGGPPPG